jgi:hypothetical protein
MEYLDSIKHDIESLPHNEFIQLRKWFSEKDWKEWDMQVKEDSMSGKLDFLFKEAFDEKNKGNLRKRLLSDSGNVSRHC